MTGLSQHFRVAIIGTGFSGLGMAIRLKQAGQNDFVILERADDIGGTWRDNSYPGCACDVPSHLYSFSFAPNPDWSRVFSPQKEIWDYMRRCTEQFGIMPFIRFNSPLQEAAWDEDSQQWRLNTPQGTITAQFIVMGYGPLSEPIMPNIPGLTQFEGKVFHSAQWDHQYDLKGKRVAVIGTGASAVQFVPQIQPKVSHLTMFQRTPSWIFPRMDHDIPAWQRKLYGVLPIAQKLVRTKMYWERELRGRLLLFKHNPERNKKAQQLALQFLESQISDPTLRAKLTPTYALGCKRILISDDFYQAVAKPNIEVVTETIKEIRPNSVVTSDGTEYSVDTIICATGFQATESPAAQLIRGQGGQLLAEQWRGGAEAYMGTTVAGFPNFFLLIGPNTGLGHNSMILMIESQITYILDALKKMDDQQMQVLEMRPEVQTSFNAELQQRLKGTVWNSGCKSWYLNKQGRNTTLWAGSTFSYRYQLRRFDPTLYKLQTVKPTKTELVGSSR